MKAKYPNGTRVKVKVGHRIWSHAGEEDIRPELKNDIATVMYTYGEKSETDYRYSGGNAGYEQYCLKFDQYGQISWFDEEDLIPQ